MSARIARRRELTGLRPGRVCLIKPSALGDVTNAFSTLAALRSLWPAAEIVWVINQSLRGLVDGHPHVDRVIPFDRARMGYKPSSLNEFAGFLRGLRRERFDVAVDLQGLLRSGLMTWATGAPYRVGLADAREGASWFYTHGVVPVGTIDEAHAVDRLLSIARAFGADVTEPATKVAVSDADLAWAEGVLADVPRPRLGLNLGARWETKRWPPRHFAELARRAHQAYGAGLFAVGAPEDRPAVEELSAAVRPVPLLDLCGATSLPKLAALAMRADVFLSNDTGPLHLAAAAGARVVGVYTCTSPKLNGPYGPFALAAETEVACKASYLVRCDKLICMTELAPGRVWPMVAAQLDAAMAAREGVA